MLLAQIYLEHLVILLSHHGSLFNWTGTNSSVLEWFYHANALRQLHFTRFRGGFEEFVCKLSFLIKLSLIRIQLNTRGTWELPALSRGEGAVWVESKWGAKRGIFLVPTTVPASPQQWFPAILGEKYYLCYADEAASWWLGPLNKTQPWSLNELVVDSLTPKFMLFPLHHTEKLGRKGQSIENPSRVSYQRSSGFSRPQQMRAPACIL